MPERESTITHEYEPIQEACGLIGVYSSALDTSRKVAIALQAAGGVQHRGQQGGGIAYPTREGVRHFAGNGLLLDIFTPSVTSTFTDESPGNWMQIHTRYGTDAQAGYHEANLQPIIARSREGTPVSTIHNGQFVDKDGIRRKVYNLTGREYPDDVTDSFLVGQLVANAPGDSWEERITNGLHEVNGAYSVMIGVQDKLFLARDQFGIRPMVVGRLGDGWLAASETHALRKAGVKPDRFILRGEVARIDENGLTTIQPGLEGAGNFCDFEWSYFGRPESLTPTFEQPDDAYFPERWFSNMEARERCGQIVAREMDPDILRRADFVTGVQDSGVPFATGLANEAGLPYRSVIIRDHYDPNGKGRLFQEADIQQIQKQVGGKLSFVPGVLKGKIVIIGDDSTVRSNVAKAITEQAWDEGAREVHHASGYPPIKYTCHLGTSLRTQEELVAWRHAGDTKRIAEEINATSITYVSISGFIRSRKQSGEIVTPRDVREFFLANGGCGGCVTGLHPISASGEIYNVRENALTTAAD